MYDEFRRRELRPVPEPRRTRFAAHLVAARPRGAEGEGGEDGQGRAERTGTAGSPLRVRSRLLGYTAASHP